MIYLHGAQAAGNCQGVSALGSGPVSELDPAGQPPSLRPSCPAGGPGAGRRTFLPGQGDDVRRTLTHHLGDVHGAVDAAGDGDGPKHGLSL